MKATFGFKNQLTLTEDWFDCNDIPEVMNKERNVYRGRTPADLTIRIDALQCKVKVFFYISFF
jgi:hypothetical protein